MKAMKKPIQKLIQSTTSGFMVLSLILPIGANATDNTSTDSSFDTACVPLLKAHQEFSDNSCADKPTDTNCKTISEKINKEGGKIALGQCMQADVAISGKDKEEIKRIIYQTTATTCGALALGEIFPISAAATEALCATASGIAAASEITLDIMGNKAMNDAQKKYDQTCKDTGITVEFKRGYGWKGTASGVGAGATILTTGLTGAGSKAGCWVCAGTMAAMGAVSWVSASNLKKLEIKSVNEASYSKKETDTAVTGFTATSGTAGKDKKNTADNSGSAPSPDSLASCTAPGNSSTQVEQCVVKQIPETAAVINNKDLMAQMKKAFKGKGLGDILKQSKGKNLNEVLANAMGVSPKTMEKFMGVNERFAKESGIADKINSHLAMSGFSKSGGSSSKSESSGSGFGNNSAVTSNLTDTAFGEQPMVKSEDPMEALYRQLDLLTADQIYENKSISLFARAAYRYRKNIDKVEKLNSALEIRTPASVKK